MRRPPYRPGHPENDQCYPSSKASQAVSRRTRPAPPDDESACEGAVHTRTDGFEAPKVW